MTRKEAVSSKGREGKKESQSFNSPSGVKGIEESALIERKENFLGSGDFYLPQSWEVPVAGALTF